MVDCPAKVIFIRIRKLFLLTLLCSLTCFKNTCSPIIFFRYGPPPSYPNLKIPGLNAPIPEGTSFGYHAGGWGKPPVDEKGKPLYGDVFGTSSLDPDVSSPTVTV